MTPVGRGGDGGAGAGAMEFMRVSEKDHTARSISSDLTSFLLSISQKGMSTSATGLCSELVNDFLG